MEIKELNFDEIGYWSEVKLDIIKDYAKEYSKILSSQKNPELEHVYIDAFAGAGIHISRTTGEFVKGSPLNALYVNPPFNKYYFIDLDRKKVNELIQIIGNRKNVYVDEGDCNEILLRKVFTKVKFEDYKRALCLLDPYGLHLNWEVIETAGKMRSIEIFLNFPVMDINRNVLWRNPEGVSLHNLNRMNSFWGDDSWQKISYSKTPDIFGYEEIIKVETYKIVEEYRKRLKNIAKFKYIPQPIPMRNTIGKTVYYLFICLTQ